MCFYLLNLIVVLQTMLALGQLHIANTLNLSSYEFV